MSKEQRFNKVLQKCKEALDSIGVKFHLHFGTALGAHREKTFIKHDNDIDVAVFHKNINTTEQVREIQKSMENYGFSLLAKLGNIHDMFEMQFEMNGIGLDIFWIKEGIYRGKKYYLYSSYYGLCDKLQKKKCVWSMRPYKTEKVDFLGKTYNVIPEKTLEDLYGKDWRIPKKYDYFEGLESGFKGLIPDYYEPQPEDKKIAFCFLLYDKHKHSDLWVKFFAGDKFPLKNYNIYTHLKEENKNTQKWISDHKIKSIKTGWCEENLVLAWIKLLQAALKNSDNKYFALLSGECIPLFSFDETYKKITGSKKSRLHVDYNAESYVNSKLLYADQWVILTRKNAEMLVKMKTSEEGKKFRREMRKKMCQHEYCYCPDEIFPIAWFVKKYGKPSSDRFKKNIRLVTSTYTYWDGKKPHPIKFNSVQLKKKRKEICKSGAVFARKFNNKAGRELAMTCGDKK